MLRRLAGQVVERFDLHRVGAVNYRQLAALLAALLPGLDKADLRRTLGHFQLMDINNDGRISYTELMHALGFVKLAVSAEVVTTAAASAPVMRQAGSAEDVDVAWHLEPRTINGVEYLLDEERGLLYKMSPKTGQPILRGKLDGVGRIQVSLPLACPILVGRGGHAHVRQTNCERRLCCISPPLLSASDCTHSALQPIAQCLLPSHGSRPQHI